MKIGFNNDRFIRLQSELLKERIGKFGFSFNEKTYSIDAVCGTINKPRKYVVSVLSQKKYYLNYGFKSRLTRAMLNVIADDYVKTQHLFFNQAITGQVKKQEKIDYFFSFRKLFKHHDYSDLEYAQTWDQIDEEQIRQTFFYGVEKHSSRSHYNSIVTTGNISISKTAHYIDLFAGFGAISYEPVILPFAGNWMHADHYYGHYQDIFNRRKRQLEYKLYVLNQLTSDHDPTSERSKLLTPLTQRASSGSFVRHVLLPHRYCIFGTSSDDDPDSTLYFSECKSDYMNCYAEWGNNFMTPCAA